jgi:outer membrane protein assembly factor BamD
LREHPDSAYSNKAGKKIEECRELLAKHELYVARFYFKSKHYEAALGRFEDLLAGYNDVLSPNTRKEVKKLIVACRERLSEETKEETDED